MLYNKFNPPPHPNSNYSCVVAAADQWTVSRCDDEHLVTCQSDVLIPGKPNSVVACARMPGVTKIIP